MSSGPITKGEVLISLPPRLALDGSGMPVEYTTDQPMNASPWLRCLASLVQVWYQQQMKDDDNDCKCNGTSSRDTATTPSSKRNFYKPYLDSLPKSYDSILNWSAREIQSFLVGTTLGTVALQEQVVCNSSSSKTDDGSDVDSKVDDQMERNLHKRFEATVVPYLSYLKGTAGFFSSDVNVATKGDTTCSTTIDNIPDAKRKKKSTTFSVTSDDIPDAKRQKMKDSSEITNKELDDIVDLFPLFRQGCMCISTRAFHMQSQTDIKSSEVSTPGNDYQGPYLLPYIDLLNHAPRLSSKHVTTLRRDADGSFLMVAERDIAVGEEVCHSYDSGDGVDAANSATDDEEDDELNETPSSSLTSAQLLQTFGFVDGSVAARLSRHFQTEEEKGQESSLSGSSITPAIIAKKDICLSCREVAKSTYPNAVCQFMEEAGLMEEGWEHWEVPTQAEDSEDVTSARWKVLDSLPDEIVVSFDRPLSEELITICCLNFLPDDAVGELFGDSDDSGSKNVLLDDEVLDDYFLGKLVLHAITKAVKEKMGTYKGCSKDIDSGHSKCLSTLESFYNEDRGSNDVGPFSWGVSHVADAQVVAKLVSTNEAAAHGELLQKFAYGTIVSLEERASLLKLKKAALNRLVQLDES